MCKPYFPSVVRASTLAIASRHCSREKNHMAKQTFCGPCRNILNGDVVFLSDDPHFQEPYHEGWFRHHFDVASLHQALEELCSICTLGYRGARADYEGTRARFWPDQLHKDNPNLFGLNLEQMDDSPWDPFEPYIAFELHDGRIQ